MAIPAINKNNIKISQFLLLLIQLIVNISNELNIIDPPNIANKKNISPIRFIIIANKAPILVSKRVK